MNHEATSALTTESAYRRSASHRLAKSLSKAIPGRSVEEIQEAIERIAYSTAHEFEPAIESGAEAVKRLKKVSETCEMLRDAIADLGPGALTRLRQTAAADPIFNQSDSGGLPLAYDAPLDSTIEELEEWSRGGRWLIRLEALRQLALVESRQIKSLIKGGGSGVFPNALRKGEQRELIQSCLNQLQDWGVDAGSALLMARGIYAAYYGRKLRAPLSSGWGRKTLADLLSTPKG